MKFLIFASVFLIAFNGISCYDYETAIQGVINEINSQLDSLSNLFSNYFFTNPQYAQQFAQLPQNLVSNPEAFNHVVNLRQNYSDVVASLDATILKTRNCVVDNIQSKHAIVNSKYNVSAQAAGNIEKLLKSKKCTNGIINGFFNRKIDEIKNGVKNEIYEIRGSYERMMFSDFVPFFMIDQLMREMAKCATPTTDVDAVDCLTRKEQLYQVPIVDLIENSFERMKQTFLDWNTQITSNLLQQVDQDLLRAYHDGMNLACKNQIFK
ncbi:uncharacterized protein LOC134830408 [Culicoides brevitarsis]|uniref:uncharacterized protein LOC134830408 n=1 Tax=Culicoides brevitarsis TaxID=469753 RepID=UPI00307B22E0